MYIHPAFEGERHAMEAFLAERGFGTLVAFGGTAPIAAHVPFLFDAGAGRLALHVARANPIHQLVEGNPRVLLTCTGPDAYVSPDWYVSGGQVPTWNYVAVHATGTAAIMDASMLRDHVDLLAAHFERRLPKPPWTSAKMDPRRLAAMLNAIVGITLTWRTLKVSGNSASIRKGAIMTVPWGACGHGATGRPRRLPISWTGPAGSARRLPRPGLAGGEPPPADRAREHARCRRSRKARR